MRGVVYPCKGETAKQRRRNVVGMTFKCGTEIKDSSVRKALFTVLNERTGQNYSRSNRSSRRTQTTAMRNSVARNKPQPGWGLNTHRGPRVVHDAHDHVRTIAWDAVC